MIRLSNRLLRAGAASLPAELSLVGSKAVGTDGSSSSWTVSLTDLSGGIDTSPSAGDFVVLGYSVGDFASETPEILTSGYTSISYLNAADSRDTNFRVAYKRMGGSPDAGVELSGHSSSNGRAVAISVWRGVDEVTPLDVTPQTATATNTGEPNPPAISPVTPGSKILVFASSGYTGSNNYYPPPDLSDFRQAQGVDTYAGCVGFGFADWSSGVFTPEPWFMVSDSTGNSCAALTLALRPAS